MTKLNMDLVCQVAVVVPDLKKAWSLSEGFSQ